jgi:hypothetical protein
MSCDVASVSRQISDMMLKERKYIGFKVIRPINEGALAQITARSMRQISPLLEGIMRRMPIDAVRGLSR